MGLAERINQAQAEVRAEKQKRQEAIDAAKAKDLAERLRIEADEARLQAEAQASLIAGLTSLLDVVGARDQLEEIKKVWKVGEIDDAPNLLSDRAYLDRRVAPSTSMGIALKHTFLI